MNLKTPLNQITGIGSGTLWKLKKLNIETLEDLIYHFPFRYDDFSKIVPSQEAQIGEVVTLKGEIWSIKNIFTRSRKIITQAIFNDGTSPITLTWLNQSWLTKQIQTGDQLQISGKLTKYKNKLSVMVPRWEKIQDTFKPQTLHTGRLVPIYPETARLSSKWLRLKISQLMPPKVTDPLPENLRADMLPLSEALQKIHFPKNWQEAEKARQRLGFDELFYVSLATQKSRMEWKKKPLVSPLKINEKDLNEFTKGLPFTLTLSQQNVLEEILADLKRKEPMNRLIQGEVGSGKTVVATIVAFLAYKNGYRTLFMAPTEILAFQHFETIKKFLENHGINVGIYTGSKKKVQDSDVVVGTHALLSDRLKIENVGLIIVDEQQRFGVEQRSYLRSKAKPPHFLTMTATPIPRTVALTVYGDLDLSVINELPKNRPKISTFLVPEKKRLDSYKYIEKKVNQGDQVYIITPLIEKSETLTTVRAVKVEFEKLQKIFPRLKLGLLHGRMKSKEKEQVLKDFQSGKIRILVSTSVVEVGMDIPNATIIVIEGAERFGLSQLHQLRGRVGRGTKESYCLLFTSDSTADKHRLKYLENTFDGLKLAELDLKIRGSGEIFGSKQSGRFEFKIASFSNLTLAEQTRDAARKLLQEDPTLDKYPSLKAKLDDLSGNAMPD